MSLPVRYDLCVCASKDRAGVEASDPADWLRHLDGHDMDGKDAWQLAHPVTAISDDGAAVTPGEQQYYIEVQTRVNQRLASVGASTAQ